MPAEEDVSYTAVQMASSTTIDPFQAGRHCTFCSRLDFLPFRCESCKSHFCLDHRSETSHNCPKAGEWARARREKQQQQLSTAAPKPNILTHEKQCSQPKCKTLIDTSLMQGVSCEYCNRRYCIPHRHRDSHGCDKLEPLGGRTTRGDRGLGDALSKLKAWGASKKSYSTSDEKKPELKTTKLQRIISPFTSRKSASSTAALLAVNSLKRTAKGDAKVPAERRLYLRLEAVGEGEGRAGARIPKADAFYDGEWKVGRALDAMAKTLAIENINNRAITEEQRLRVFWIEGGRLLEFSEKLADVMESGSDRKLMSGDTLVLLRGVGPMDGSA